MKKRRAVKEGSPFEEEYLLELLRDDTKCTQEDKDSVKALMKIMMFFGLVEESTTLHSLVDKVIRTSFEASCLMSVE